MTHRPFNIGHARLPFCTHVCRVEADDAVNTASNPSRETFVSVGV